MISKFLMLRFKNRILHIVQFVSSVRVKNTLTQNINSVKCSWQCRENGELLTTLVRKKNAQ